MMKKLIAKIAENKMVAQGFYRMRIESAYLAKNARPGQFVEIKCSDGNEPLLRRPLGVHRIRENGIELLYEVVGKGTQLLSKKKSGDTVDIIGPLGNGFDLSRTTHDALRTTIIVAGGIGVAPLVALAEELVHSPQSTVHGKKVHVLIGARTKSHILCEAEFKKMGCRVVIATEDGSKGFKGLATDLLRTAHDALRTTIYACGPAAMLKTVAKIAGVKRIPCQVSIEERMACGIGVCLGCPVKIKPISVPDGAYSMRYLPSGTGMAASTKYEYKMVCKDGPVFNAEEIAW